MSAVGIALIQALPVIVIGVISNNKFALNCTAIIMILIAGSSGKASYFFMDAVFIGIAYFIGFSIIENSDKNK